ncbi:MAG: DUF4198 domain-containing protein [Treponema sp.]|jgi:uncharacterized GH25 family protein|nr:DUF4198 domain-containing protein [Treponema sp.]
MKSKNMLVTFALCAAIAAAAQAHETFIIPGDTSKDYKAGDTAALIGISSHYFAVGEEIEPPETVEMYVYKNGVKGGNIPLEANRDRLWYEGRYRLTDDTPVIAVFRSIGGFYSILTDGSYADGNRSQALAANPGKSVQVSRYFTKWGKLYLNPNRNDRNFSQALGLDFEIVPLNNPAEMRRGSSMRLRVLYKGQPWANGEVKATWDYYDYHTMDAWAQTGKTDTKGEVSFRLDHVDMKKPVLWIFQAGDTRKSSQPNADEDNLKATLVFAVK